MTDAVATPPRPIVLMGVSGSGKTVLGRAAASRLGVPFVDADDLHDPAARARMASGLPLDDELRAPWLDRVGAGLAARPHPVAACSALRRRYRDRLRQHAPDTVFVHLVVPERLLVRRVSARRHEYMPASLLTSQLEALEPLQPDEAGFAVAADFAPEPLVDLIVARLASQD